MAPCATQVSISVMLAVRAVSSTMQWTALVEDILLCWSGELLWNEGVILSCGGRAYVVAACYRVYDCGRTMSAKGHVGGMLLSQVTVGSGQGEGTVVTAWLGCAVPYDEVDESR